jgi:transcriptional regulator with XRE-family HTH domain
MQRQQNAVMTDTQVGKIRELGERLAEMRRARNLLQKDVAERANLSRVTASRIENGDAGVAIGQIIRYLDVIAPGITLGQVYREDAAVAMQKAREPKRRASRGNRVRRTQNLNDAASANGNRAPDSYDF